MKAAGVFACGGGEGGGRGKIYTGAGQANDPIQVLTLAISNARSLVKAGEEIDEPFAARLSPCSAVLPGTAQHPGWALLVRAMRIPWRLTSPAPAKSVPNSLTAPVWNCLAMAMRARPRCGDSAGRVHATVVPRCLLVRVVGVLRVPSLCEQVRPLCMTRPCMAHPLPRAPAHPHAHAGNRSVYVRHAPHCLPPSPPAPARTTY